MPTIEPAARRPQRHGWSLRDKLGNYNTESDSWLCSTAEDESEEEEEEAFEDIAAAPNVVAAQSDIHRLREQLAGRALSHPEQPPIAPVDRPRNYLEIPGIRNTPLNDFNDMEAENRQLEASRRQQYDIA